LLEKELLQGFLNKFLVRFCMDPLLLPPNTKDKGEGVATVNFIQGEKDASVKKGGGGLVNFEMVLGNWLCGWKLMYAWIGFDS
jgi:hypothetical protein